MDQLRRKLPPMNALVVFEAAARRLNFTHAARELAVTQAAVSRQIALLEDDLGTALFRRLHRSLELTREGERLRQAVTMGLEHIANAAVDIRRARKPGEVTLSTSVSFASYWLIERLAKFRALHPDVELRVVASAPVRDLASAGIDIAIRYGSGDWPGVKAVHLFDNEVWPVCAPAYLGGRQLKAPAELLHETLLHLEQYDRNWVTWPAWFEAFGVAGEADRPGFTYDHYQMLIQAALRGQGVALCGGRLAEDFVARGTLVRPLPHALGSERCFYLLYPEDVPLSPGAVLVRDWLIAEARGGGGEPLP